MASETKLTKSEIDFLLRAARKNRDSSASFAEVPGQRWQAAHLNEVAMMDEIIGKLEAMDDEPSVASEQLGVTVREACKDWVRGFDAIQLSMVEKLVNGDEDSWREVTRPSEGTRVYSPEYGEGSIAGIIKKDGHELRYEVTFDRTEGSFAMDADGFDVEESADFLPMWGTMWQMGDRLDEEWLENHLQEASECGLRIYEHDEWGYFIGIDGGGYDFFEDHWVPLYRERGLQWHTEKKEGAALGKEHSSNAPSLSDASREAKEASAVLSVELGTREDSARSER